MDFDTMITDLEQPNGHCSMATAGITISTDREAAGIQVCKRCRFFPLEGQRVMSAVQPCCRTSYCMWSLLLQFSFPYYRSSLGIMVEATPQSSSAGWYFLK